MHFVGADDAHGAPIMLAAEKAGQDAAGSSSPRSPAGRKQYLDGFHIALRQLAFDRLAGEHASSSQDIYRALRKARPDRRRKRSSSSTTR